MSKARALLKDRLQNDTFYAVRLEAIKALDKTRSPEALAILLDAGTQTDARVRNELTKTIGRVYDLKARDHLMKTIQDEKNPEIVASALREIGKYQAPAVRDLLIASLDRDAFRHTIARAAISGMKKNDDPAFIDHLKKHLDQHPGKFRARDFGHALETLAFLAREKEKKEPVRRFLARQVNNAREPVQLAAIKALGTLGDPKAIGILQSFQVHGAIDGTRAKKVSDEAGKQINNLRAKKSPANELKDLRQKVDQLIRQVEQQQKALEKTGEK